MPTIIVNHTILDASQVHSIRFYAQITRQKTYKSVGTKNAAGQIIKFMRNVYLMDHPFDELDFTEDKLTPSETVANIVVPKRCDSIAGLIEIAIDFDNMIALCKMNYEKFYNEPARLTATQVNFIESKSNALAGKYNVPMTLLEHKPVEKLIENKSQDVRPLMLIDKSPNSKSERCIMQFTKDGQFMREWANVRTASETLGIDRWGIYNCASGNRKTAGGFIWKFSVNSVADRQNASTMDSSVSLQ